MKKIHGGNIVLALVVVFSVFSIAFASPPSSPYQANETLNPSCAPGDSNCIVELSFLTGEIDPIFILSPSFGIGTGNISDWNTAFGWGNHATQGYLTGGLISSLNGLTSGIQNFITGTTGTGFHIISSGSTHSFNIPFATGGISGLLSGSDWNIFRNKQNTLIAGAGIDITGNTISASSTSGWQLGGSAGGGQALGSTDSILPFMSNGNIKMQLSDSNLSLSNNGSFVDIAGKNGLFIGNNNSYGDSENVLAIGETLDIRAGNKNIFTIGNQVDHIENNTNSFFAGEELSGVSNNNNVLAFGNRNTVDSNTNSVLFGEKNNWSNETYKFIVGNDNQKWFQVDMSNGEVQFKGSPGTAGQYFVSSGPGTSPSWADFPSVTGISSLNGLTSSSQTFATGSTGNNFNISSTSSTHTFNIPDASLTARGFVSLGTQSFTGAKTFTVNPTFSSMTLGSIAFIGASGLLSQNNSRLFWDSTNNQLLASSGGTAALPSYSFFGDPDTGMYHITASPNSLRFAAGGTTVGRMEANGWGLGDGSMTPISLVHIGGGVNPATFRMTNTTSANTVSDGFLINFTGTGVSLNNMEASEISFGTTNTERMRITGTGGVAIGQTTAVEKLEVNGGIKVGTSATICNAAAAGAIRYNSGINKHEGCNGTAWTALY